MFVVEMVAGRMPGRRRFQADALDFLADSLTYGASLFVIGIALRTRSLRRPRQGREPLLIGLSVLGSTLYRVFVAGVPEADIMGIVAVLALAANVASVLLLVRYRTATPMSARSGSARGTTRSAMSP